MGRPPLLWDNTLYAHASSEGYDFRHPYYLFDFFNTRYPEQFHQSTSGILYNGGATVIYKVGRLNTAEYLWNPEAYDAKSSLQGALLAVSGLERSQLQLLLGLRNAFYEVFDTRHSGRRLTAKGQSEIMASNLKMNRFLGEVQQAVPNQALALALEEACKEHASLPAEIKEIQEFNNGLQPSVLLKFPSDGESWSRSVNGPWDIEFADGFFKMFTPQDRVSAKGEKAELSCRFAVPTSPTQRYYIHFSVADNHDSKIIYTPWELDQLQKQILIDGELVWQDSVEGQESLKFETTQVANVTAALRDKKEAVLTLRAIDRTELDNAWVEIYWGAIDLVASPFPELQTEPMAEAIN